MMVYLRLKASQLLPLRLAQSGELGLPELSSCHAPNFIVADLVFTTLDGMSSEYIKIRG